MYRSKRTSGSLFGPPRSKISIRSKCHPHMPYAHASRVDCMFPSSLDHCPVYMHCIVACCCILHAPPYPVLPNKRLPPIAENTVNRYRSGTPVIGRCDDYRSISSSSFFRITFYSYTYPKCPLTLSLKSSLPVCSVRWKGAVADK